MTEMTESADLAIPYAAAAMLLSIDDDWDDDADLHNAVRAIAAPVVAAELRRLAAEWSPVDEYGSRKLRRRADELDPPAVRQED